MPDKQVVTEEYVYKREAPNAGALLSKTTTTEYIKEDLVQESQSDHGQAQPSEHQGGESASGTASGQSSNCSPSSPPKFKVGDRVRRISEFHYTFRNDGSTYKVVAVNHQGYLTFENVSNLGGTGWDPENFELARPEPKFKVGDKVIVKSGYSKSDTVRTVAGIGSFSAKEDCWIAWFEPVPGVRGNNSYEKNVELASTHKFKVGDLVRCIDVPTHVSGFSVATGKVYEVSAVHLDCWHDEVGYGLKGVPYGDWRESRFELASAHQFKVGDRVRINDTCVLDTHAGRTLKVTNIYSKPLLGYDLDCDNGFAYQNEWLDLLPPLHKIKLVGGPLHGAEYEVSQVTSVISRETNDDANNRISHTYQRMLGTYSYRYTNSSVVS